MHTEHEAIFYQMGSLQTYDLKCELFEFSNERFNTGVTEIDTLFARYITTTEGAIANVESVDALADNFTIETIGDDIIDFSETNTTKQLADMLLCSEHFLTISLSLAKTTQEQLYKVFLFLLTMVRCKSFSLNSNRIQTYLLQQ